MISFIKYSGSIMYSGDSITVGNNALTGGWRVGLNNLFDNEARNYSCVGTYNNYSPSMSNPNHEGLGGIKLSLIKNSFSSLINTFNPNIIILGYGMNDLGQGGGYSNLLNDYNFILNQIFSVKFVKVYIQKLIIPISDPYGYSSYTQDYIDFNNNINSLKINDTIEIIDIDNIALSDGVHPIDGVNGYLKMANQIHSAIN